MPHRSNWNSRCFSLLFLLLFSGCPASPAVSQTTQAAPAAGQKPGVAPPESQPALNVDRDPVPSPDPDDNMAVSPAAPTGKAGTAVSGSAGQVGKNSSGQFTIRQSVEEVVLNATVLDQDQRLVTTLDKGAFRVLEDNVQQTILSVRQEDLPVSVGILIDNSGSMTPKRRSVEQAALDMIRSSNPQDEEFIVNFSDEAMLDQDFTSDVNKLKTGLSQLDSKGATALYDAVVASAYHLSKAAKLPKQVLLIITDGEDNASSQTLEDTVRQVQDLQGPIVYSIGLLFGDTGGGREAKRARRALEALSNETGGVAYFPKSLSQVDEIAAEVAKDIRSQYTIGYKSTKPASLGGYRAVKVEAKSKGYGKLTVRTRTGYYPRTDETKRPLSRAAGS